MKILSHFISLDFIGLFKLLIQVIGCYSYSTYQDFSFKTESNGRNIFTFSPQRTFSLYWAVLRCDIHERKTGGSVSASTHSTPPLAFTTQPAMTTGAPRQHRARLSPSVSVKLLQDKEADGRRVHCADTSCLSSWCAAWYERERWTVKRTQS